MAPVTLQEREGLPRGLYEADAEDLHALLGGPTLIHLPGRQDPPLFVSILLHGDETTGFEAVRALLRDATSVGTRPMFPRSLSLFIGNTEAAAHGVRRLDGQPDFNRIWSGDLYGDCPEQNIVQQVTEIMRRRGVFASVDVHNNTGRNPHYGCVNLLEPDVLALAGKFSETVVYFRRPAEVQSMAFSQFCPAVTLECGQAGDRDGAGHVADYLRLLLGLDTLGQIGSAQPDAVFHTTVTVKLSPETTFAFEEDGEAADIVFTAGLETLNFHEAAAGTVFATMPGLLDFEGLSVTNETGVDVAADYFRRDGHNLLLRKPVTLSMFTTNPRAVRQDCLCYFMEPYPVPA